jgi:hypothetical protein
MMRFDYNRITAPGPVLTVRIPGIYADPAGSPEGSKKSCKENMTACCPSEYKGQ